MTGHLIATRGLPGSGKSTWAAEQFGFYGPDTKPGRVVRANRDDLRAMLAGPDYGRPHPAVEAMVTEIQDTAIVAGLTRGAVVIVDDCNLAERYMTRLGGLAERCGATMSVKDFRDVPLETCIARDRNRRLQGGRYVGPEVIRTMHAIHLATSA